MAYSMTELEKSILFAVRHGGRKAHLNYLPQVLALVSKGYLQIIKQTDSHIFVEESK